MPSSSARRRPLPPGRVFFSDLPKILGVSRATVYRDYRPTDPNERAARARLLDLRVRDGDGALHCSADAVGQERERLQQAVYEGPIAVDPVPRSERFLSGVPRRPSCGACQAKAATAAARFCASCGRPYE
jgi:hypothetical protein